MKRQKTDYPGVFYREADRVGGKGKEKVFYILFKKGGTLHEEKVGRQFADDMTAARAARIRGERIEGKRKSRKEIREERKASVWTLSKIFEAWKEHKAEKRSLAQDKSRFSLYLESELGGKEPKDIVSLDIDKLKRVALKGKSPATVKLTLALLRSVVNWGHSNGLCQGLSFKIEMPRVNNLKTEDLLPDQVKALLKAIAEDIDTDAGDVMRLALFTGMRRGELLKLQWNDIDFRRGFIKITSPKGGPDQMIPLNEAARGVLEGRRESIKGSYVFPGIAGKHRADVAKSVKRIKEAAKLPLDFRPLHGLRHTYASMLASSGQVDLFTLQKLLTHKSPLMTQRYAHLRDESLKRASDLAGEIVTDIITSRRSPGAQNQDEGR